MKITLQVFVNYAQSSNSGIMPGNTELKNTVCTKFLLPMQVDIFFLGCAVMSKLPIGLVVRFLL